MHVNVVDGLSRMLSVIDDQSIPLLQALLLGNPGSSHQQLSQNQLVSFLGFGDSSEAILILGDYEDVCGRDWRNIPKGEDEVVLKDHLGGYLFSDQFVEDGFVCHLMIYNSV